MTLRGIVDRSLGQLCFRGFAPIKELARISKADYEYQRDIVDRQQARISNFLDNEKYLFFPEVILSYTVKVKLDNPKTAVQLIEESKGFYSNNRNVNFKFAKSTVLPDEVKVLEITFNDEFLNNLIENDKQPFHRIDGNHRLSAAEESNTSFINNLKIPFCIILGQEFTDDTGIVPNSDTEDFKKAIQVYFHNINTKTIPLTSEENLKGIINNKDRFPDDEVSKIIETDGKLVRNLLSKTNNFIVYPEVKKNILDYEKSFTVALINLLLDKKFRKFRLLNKILNSLGQANSVLIATQISFNPSLLLALLYYLTKNNDVTHFLKWCLSSRIDAIEYISEYNIIDLYDEYAKSEIKVFVAMPYFNQDSEIVRGYNEAYERIITKINNTYPDVKISLYPIMENIGRTRDIVQNVINEIKQSKIFIADLSEKNPNVAYEFGFARSLDVPCISVIKRTEDIPFDYNHDNAIKYNGTGPLNDLERKVYDAMLGILQKDYNLIIE